jgi:hypothetical protein
MQVRPSLPGRADISFEFYRTGVLSVLLCSILATALPLAAETRQSQSALAGVALPVASVDWSADADGSKAATLDLAAALAGADCEAREAHAWEAGDPSAAESIRARTEAAFGTAGWSLQPVSRTAEGQRILFARRGAERLVMVWRPEESEIGLLLCRTQSAPGAASESAAQQNAPEPEAHSFPRAPEPDRLGRIEDAFGKPAAAPPEAATPAETPKTAPAVAERIAAPQLADSAANLWLRLLAVGFLVVGGIGLIVRDFRARALSVEWQWPTAPATIERGWIEEVEEEDTAGNPVKAYVPMLRYRYRVDGEDFQGGAIGLDDRPMPSAEAALRRLSQYPDFATVEVRYDPEDPSFAVIEVQRPPPGQEFYFGLGAIVLALAVLAAHLR